ncbi:MAG TPA: formyltetrahydrofolate deformylase [Kofleriaceae bacterium]|nr:formyltetrahydrofolate deformylase [Kofleriaceae bacterium]
MNPPRPKSATWSDESFVAPLEVGETQTPSARKSSLLSPRSTGEMGTLMVGGPDRKGIHATLATLLHEHGVNIVHSGQHTGGGMFFERIRFDLTELTTGREHLEQAVKRVCAQFGLDYRLYGDRKKRVAILVSKYEHCLYDLLVRHRSGDLPPCEIAVIISNHPDARECAAHFQIPFRQLPVTAETKQQQELQVMSLLRATNIDLVVLARYMQILSPAFVERYTTRIINVHHSFLPAFIGANPYRQAYERGVKLIGATSHYVTSDLDQGPILEQEVIKVSHRDTVEDLRRKGRDLEKRVLASAVRWHLEDRVLVHQNKTVVFE